MYVVNFKNFSLIVFLLLLFACVNVSAIPPAQPDQNITIYHPINGTSCYVPHENDENELYVDFQYIPYQAYDNCQLYTNSSGSFMWAVTDYSISSQVENEIEFYIDYIPQSILWGIRCQSGTDIYWSINASLYVTDAPYCAVLSETSCKKTVNLYSKGICQTRLGNTNGIWLENQDCQVNIKDSNGELVKVFDTLMNSQETDIQLDESGNWINTGSNHVPLTDSLGWYNFEFNISSDWAWVGDEYLLSFVCNGQTATAKFNVTKMRLPDENNLRQVGKDASGWILLGLIVFFIIIYLLKKVRLK